MVIEGQYVVTDEEKRRLKGEALLESSEAADHLRLLLSEALVMGDTLIELGKRVRNLRGVNATGNAEREILKESPTWRIPDSTVLTALINSILEARERSHKANERLKDLGIIH